MTPDPQPTMKNDPSFKFVAAIIIAGVIAAMVGPSNSVAGPHAADDPAAVVRAAE